MKNGFKEDDKLFNNFSKSAAVRYMNIRIAIKDGTMLA